MLASHLLVVLGALFGAGGVALSAAAAHVSGGTSVETAARFLLFNAPVLVLVPVLARLGLAAPGLALSAGGVIGLGVLLFSGDLAMRGLRGAALFPMAAPSGGMLLIAGFLMLALAAAWPLVAPAR